MYSFIAVAFSFVFVVALACSGCWPGGVVVRGMGAGDGVSAPRRVAGRGGRWPVVQRGRSSRGGGGSWVRLLWWVWLSGWRAGGSVVAQDGFDGGFGCGGGGGEQDVAKEDHGVFSEWLLWGVWGVRAAQSSLRMASMAASAAAVATARRMSVKLMVFSPGGCVCGGGAVSVPGGQGGNGGGNGGDGVLFPVDWHVWLLACVG